MKKSKQWIRVFIICAILLTACKHTDKEIDYSVTPTISPDISPTQAPSTVVTISPTEALNVVPTQSLEKEPSPTITPTPNSEVTPGVPEISKDPRLSPTPVITIEPSVTISPSVTIMPPSNTPEPTVTPEVTQVPSPTPTVIPEVMNLGKAVTTEIEGSNGKTIESVHLIKNPLLLQMSHSEFTKRLLAFIPTLNTYVRRDSECFNWSYRTTDSNVPIVSISSYLSSEGKNKKEDTMYYVGYGYNANISDEPSELNIIIGDGLGSMDYNIDLFQSILQGVLPEERIQILLDTKGVIQGDNNRINAMDRTLNFIDTPYFVRFHRLETLSEKNDGRLSELKLRVDVNKPNVIYSTYRNGLVLHEEKFKEFPLDFSQFFIPLDPYHNFKDISYRKDTDYKKKEITSYTAEFNGYDRYGNYTTIIVTVDNALGEYTISEFRYYTSNERKNIENQLTFDEIVDYYTSYLNSIMTLATYNKEEFLTNATEDSTSVIKDVTVSDQTVPCNVVIRRDKKDERLSYLDIEYSRP